MVGQAVAQRTAWLTHHLCLDPCRFGRESEPDWHECNLLTYDRRNLRKLGERSLCWLLGMEVERLLRLAQVSPAEPGIAAWLAGVLAASEHVDQVYHELRRYKAARARAILRGELAAFLSWQGDSPAQGATTGEAFTWSPTETCQAGAPSLARSAITWPSMELINTAPSTTGTGAP
jgi:hypothetical protein